MAASGQAASWQLGMAGFCAIAVSFGPARAGYGLFLPDFREEFGLSIGLSGFIASGLQAGYLVALTAVGLAVARVGPRPPVVLGGWPPPPVWLSWPRRRESRCSPPA